MPKSTAKPVFKLLQSAMANAVNNFQAKKETLTVAQAFVDNGPMIKRMMPRAMGRGTPIRHHTSHITMILQGEGVLAAKEVKKEAVAESVVEGKIEDGNGKAVSSEKKKPAARKAAKTVTKKTKTKETK
jgi:large subunit ribosomal protein L22